MAPISQTVGQGLFRLRSVTPLPVIGICLWLLWSRTAVAGPGGGIVDAVFDGLGVGLAFAGQALRFYVLGWVPEGTSGQDLSLKASTLNTTGPYAFVRNPLYLGNLGIVLGLCCIAHHFIVYAVVLGFFFGEYFFIIRAEERFLRAKFSDAFEEFVQRVPRWIPRFTPANRGALRGGSFDWRRALKKEVNPFSAWSLGALGLLVFEAYRRGTLDVYNAGVVIAVAAMIVMALFTVKAWKKGWLFS